MQVVLSLGEAQLGKKLKRFDWEKAVYQQLFMLANTLFIYSIITLFQKIAYYLHRPGQALKLMSL